MRGKKKAKRRDIMKFRGHTRREVLSYFVKMAAVTAGLGVAETKKLLGQIRKRAAVAIMKRPDVTKLIDVTANDRNVKALKILLMPKSEMAKVFRSEFGRNPLFKPKMNRNKVPICANYIGSGLSCDKLDCGIHVCNSETCPIYANRGPSFTEQFLMTMGECDTKCDHCAAKDKPCWFNKKSINLGEIYSNWIREVRTDPFMQALFKEFDSPSEDDLEQKLRTLLNQRKAELR